jgi:hypothetical protein
MVRGERRQIVYDAVLYGLGATLAELGKTQAGARLAEQIHLEFGRHLSEYLRLRGLRWLSEGPPEKIVESILRAFLEDLDFAHLEHIEPTDNKGNRAVWRDLLGHHAYEELAKKYSDPFLACPLNAAIRHELERHGYTLVVHGCESNYASNTLESWEEVRQGKRFIQQTT